MHRMFTMAAVVLMLLGCGREVRPTKPVVIEVPGPTVYVKIPPEMTKRCPIEANADSSPLEANRVARERRKSLVNCNLKLERIEAIQGTPVPIGESRVEE